MTVSVKQFIDIYQMRPVKYRFIDITTLMKVNQISINKYSS